METHRNQALASIDEYLRATDWKSFDPEDQNWRFEFINCYIDPIFWSVHSSLEAFAIQLERDRLKVVGKFN